MDQKTYPYPPQQQQQVYPQQTAMYPPQGGGAYPPQAPIAGAYPPSYGPGYVGADDKGYAAASYPPMPQQQQQQPVVMGVPPAARFSPPEGPQDLWAAVLYGVHLIGLAVLSYASVSQINWTNMTVKGRTYPTTPTNTNSGNTGGANLQFGTSAISAVVVAAVASGIASLIYLMVMRRYPKQLIKVTFWISFVYFLLVGIAAIVLVRNIVLGVIFLVFAVFYALAYRWYKTRIPFAAVVLSTVTGVTQKYPGTVWVAVCGLLVNLAFSAWWIVTVVACTLVYGETTTRTASGGQKVSPLMYPVWVFLMFSMYWTSQVIQNTVHVTISGVFASYYFMAGSQQGMPSNPTMGALKRATTTSFGSICYGSLLIAIIRTLKAIMKQAQQNTDSAAAQFVACCLQCLLGCVEGLLEFFNHYAFVQCAIYGKDYCRAAKDTWTLIKDRGIDLIINDSMVDRVLGYGALLVAGVSTLIAWGVYAAGNAAAGTVSTAGVDVTMIIVLIAAAAIGFVIMSLVGTVIDSGVASTFVCLAEDPAALKATKPELWEKIRETYPSAAFISMYA